MATYNFLNTAWSLLPPVVAITLALITKEVYSSLFIGILAGGFLFTDLNFISAIKHVFNGGFVKVLSDSSNQIIIIFILCMAMLIILIGKTGGADAFGIWASKNVKGRKGAQLSTILLGLLIFIDDFFNCLTVGSVMRPVADKNNVSRAKLAYLIDATAAPICIIAPVSSWAAAVSSYAEDGQGLYLFIRAIPYNFYSLLTIVMMFSIALMDFDFGSMSKYENDAKNNSVIFSNANSDFKKPAGRIIDLVFPVLALIILCIIGIIYTGGYFNGVSFVDAFANSDAPAGLATGSAIALVLTIIYILLFCRTNVKFFDIIKSVPETLRLIVPPLIILIMAWALKTMTDDLGAKNFIESVVKNSATGFQATLPAIIFGISCFISFATGTSWGTFGILIPITLNIFPLTNPLGIICVSASMAGAVCGDHCSPVSDTTIAASMGARCNHVIHVSTQLPYAITVACVSFVTYIIAGFVPNYFIALPIGIILMIMTLLIIRRIFVVK